MSGQQSMQRGALRKVVVIVTLVLIVVAFYIGSFLVMGR